MSGTPAPAPGPDDPRGGNPINPSTWITIGGVIIIIVVIGTVTRWNSFGGGGSPRPTPSSGVSAPPGPSSAASFPESGSCNPGDVKLTVHLYGHMDIGMTYRDDTSTQDQTSWPAGNAPFPNSFPNYPAPWLRYGCFHKLATVHLTFNNADEPWTAFSRSTGGGCDLSRPLTIGRTYTAAEMGPLSCTIGMQGDAEVNAYWAEPSYVNGALADFREFPACLPGGTPGYCPPATIP